MATMKIISRLMRFKGFRAVNLWFEGRGRKETLVIAVKPHKTGCRCPECGRRGKIVHTREWRRWSDSRAYGRTVQLHYAPREIRCPTHGRHVEQIPWAAPSAQVSYRFEYLLLRFSQWMPQNIAARMLAIAPSTLSDRLHRIIERERQGHKPRGLKTIGIDEISYARGRKFATVVYDLDRSCVVWVAKGKGRETIDRFFKAVLSDYQRKQIKWACCDMSDAYMGAIKQHCPNAQLVLDRFHVVKALNDAVDEVRKEQWREVSGDDRTFLKGLRWILLSHSSTHSRKDRQTLRDLERTNRRIYRAWRLKDEFERFWDYKARWAAERFLANWTTRAMRSRLEPLKKFVRTVRNHREGILAFVDTRLTNAVSEGINRIIRRIKNRASGFEAFDAFTDIIFLCVGDVDIPAQIPARHRTL